MLLAPQSVFLARCIFLYYSMSPNGCNRPRPLPWASAFAKHGAQVALKSNRRTVEVLGCLGAVSVNHNTPDTHVGPHGFRTTASHMCVA